MKKMISMIMVVCVLFSLTACSDKKEEPEQLTTIVIPKSFYTFADDDPEEAAKTYKELGSDYCIDAHSENGAAILQVTETQRENLIKRNKEIIDRLIRAEIGDYEQYYIEGDEDYKRISFYFDEKLFQPSQIKLLGAITGLYGLNQIFKFNNEEWNVNVTVYNCHTKKMVASTSMPGGYMKYGAEEWRNSYNE